MSQKSKKNTVYIKEPGLRKYLCTDMNGDKFVSSDIHHELVAELKSETVRFPVYKLVGVRERQVEELSIEQDRTGYVDRDEVYIKEAIELDKKQLCVDWNDTKFYLFNVKEEDNQLFLNYLQV